MATGSNARIRITCGDAARVVLDDDVHAEHETSLSRHDLLCSRRDRDGLSLRVA